MKGESRSSGAGRSSSWAVLSRVPGESARHGSKLACRSWRPRGSLVLVAQAGLTVSLSVAGCYPRRRSVVSVPQPGPVVAEEAQRRSTVSRKSSRFAKRPSSGEERLVLLVADDLVPNLNWWRPLTQRACPTSEELPTIERSKSAGRCRPCPRRGSRECGTRGRSSRAGPCACGEGEARLVRASG